MDRDRPRGDWFGDISDDSAAYHDRFFDSHRGDFSGDANHQPQHNYPPYQYRQQHHHYQHPDHRHHYNFNAEYNDSVGSRGDFTSSHSFPLPARKRQFSHSARGPDVYIVRDELRQSRGCAFIQFSHRDMAVAAINALNGTYVMRGCDQPLIVRFADPKKPKTGDSRDNCKFGSSSVASHFEESVVRGAPYLNEPITGHALSNASGPLSPKTMTSSSQSPQTGGKVQTVSSTSTASELILPSSTSAHTVPISNQTEELDCDWSEHTCPDGYKYYYNRITRESRWEKPEEYSWFEEQLLKQQEQEQHQRSSSQQEQDSSCQQVHSLANPQALPHQEVS